MKKYHILIAVFFLYGIISGCIVNLDNENPRFGMVNGVVTIGPLCPVEPCHISEEDIDDIYDLRKIIIYREDTSTVVQTVDIEYDRTYKAYLMPGRYIVDINHTGIDYSSDVPKAITIEADKILRLDIDIDTGIR